MSCSHSQRYLFASVAQTLKLRLSLWLTHTRSSRGERADEKSAPRYHFGSPTTTRTEPSATERRLEQFCTCKWSHLVFGEGSRPGEGGGRGAEKSGSGRGGEPWRGSLILILLLLLTLAFCSKFFLFLFFLSFFFWVCARPCPSWANWGACQPRPGFCGHQWHHRQSTDDDHIVVIAGKPETRQRQRQQLRLETTTMKSNMEMGKGAEKERELRDDLVWNETGAVLFSVGLSCIDNVELIIWHQYAWVAMESNRTEVETKAKRAEQSWTELSCEKNSAAAHI